MGHDLHQGWARRVGRSRSVAGQRSKSRLCLRQCADARRVFSVRRRPGDDGCQPCCMEHDQVRATQARIRGPDRDQSPLLVLLWPAAERLWLAPHLGALIGLSP
jgi:hypothetical protein